MNKIKNYFNKNKVTIMVIPNAERSIKQWKINLAAVFIVLICLIMVNVALLFDTINSKVTSGHLYTENNVLSESLQLTQDTIASLENIKSNNSEEITTLKGSLEKSTAFLQDRLNEMDKAQEYITQLVVLFNSETSSKLPVPTSRSFSRVVPTVKGSVSTAETEDEILFSQIDALIANDEISTIISEQTENYTELVTNLETQLNYLVCRPDFYPTQGTYSSPFGYRKDPITGKNSKHNGIDISNQPGTRIYAAGTGVVTFAGYDGNFGNVMIIDHGYGYESVYAHCKTLLYKPGDTVTKGDLIAKMGSTGRTTGPHLHFEIRFNKNPINPLNILK